MQDGDAAPRGCDRTAVNRWIYRTAHWLRRRAAPRAAALRRRLPPSVRTGAPADRPALLHLANGRLGDALLAAAYTARYREWFGATITAVARPETEAVVAPLVDAFVPFDPGAPPAAPTGLHTALGRLRGPFAMVLGDLHLFHGGEALLALAEAVAAPVTVLYEGWIDRSRQAPLRRWPRAAHVVAALDKPPGPRGGPGPTDAARLHVLGDLEHYHARALARLGGRAGTFPPRPLLPATALDRAAPARLCLPAGYVACQPSSSQPKKDWPAHRFAAVLEACPLPVVLLGREPTARDRALHAALHAVPRPAAGHAPVVLDLRGRTSVPEALAIAAAARAFVGVDSALAHAAALASVPTVVAMPASTPGYFFPYPPGLAGIRTTAVCSEDHAACAGCGGICRHELLPRSRRRGLPCVRALRPEPVLRALRAALETTLEVGGDHGPEARAHYHSSSSPS